MDPLSDVLTLLKPESYMFRGLDAGGIWSIAFAEDESIKCYALMSGQCWLLVDGVPDALRLGAGDCVLLPKGSALRLASDLSATSVDAEALFSSAREGGAATLNCGGDFFGIGGYFVSVAAMPTSCPACCRPSFIFRRKQTRRRYVGV